MNRNTRTLILCFSFALVSLVPLRFVELGSETDKETNVLGTSVMNNEVKLEYGDVFVGGASESEESDKGCTKRSDANEVESKIIEEMNVNKNNQTKLAQLEKDVCEK